MSDVDCMCGEPWPCSALRQGLRVIEGFDLQQALEECDAEHQRVIKGES